MAYCHTRSLGRVHILHTIFYFIYVNCDLWPQQTAVTSCLLVCVLKNILSLRLKRNMVASGHKSPSMSYRIWLHTIWTIQYYKWGLLRYCRGHYVPLSYGSTIVIHYGSFWPAILILGSVILFSNPPLHPPNRVTSLCLKTRRKWCDCVMWLPGLPINIEKLSYFL